MGMGRARSGGGPGVGLLELLTELNYGLTWAKAAHGAALFLEEPHPGETPREPGTSHNAHYCLLVQETRKGYFLLCCYSFLS